MKVTIKHRYTAKVLFSCDIGYKVPASRRTAIAVEKAVKAGVSLVSSDLGGANLAGANLRGADLIDANLTSANLTYTNLIRANLSYAHMEGAKLEETRIALACLWYTDLRSSELTEVDLVSAELAYANFAGACWNGAPLVGERPFLAIGPIGSRNDRVLFVHTKKGLHVQTGCFSGTISAFEKAVARTHRRSFHRQDYQAAISLAKTVLRSLPDC